MNQIAGEADPQREWASRDPVRGKTPDIVPGVPADLFHSVDQ
jgi:hypothetical protein